MASRFKAVFIATALSLVTACSEGETPTETDDPAGLTIVSGNTQIGIAGEELEEPLVVRVTDEEDEPIEGATVEWMVTTGGGSIETTSALTDADGRAEARWTLGEALGEQTVKVTINGLSAVFRATAEDDRLPALVIVAAGDGQSAPVSTPLLNPLVVRVENVFGRPIAGLEVEWSVETGGGVVTPSSTTTDSEGRAQVQWTLGPTAGQQTALATVAGISARFRATAGGARF